VNLDVAGRVAVVGGSSAGLGYATAEKLALEGARVLVVSRSDDRVSEAVERIRRAGGTEVAGIAVAFLCSGSASGITGVALPVDGGFRRGLV